ncbi:MAG: hypothetical protein QXV17_04955 [Candidatus Micrarchaeaceae archaeon]
MVLTIIFQSGKVSKVSFDKLQIFKCSYNEENKKVFNLLYEFNHEKDKQELSRQITWCLFEPDDKFIITTDDALGITIIAMSEGIAMVELN